MIQNKSGMQSYGMKLGKNGSSKQSADSHMVMLQGPAAVTRKANSYLPQEFESQTGL